MTTTTETSGRPGAREVTVWDPLVRLIHWSVALGVLANSVIEGDATLHHWIGYAALVLVGLRLIWGLIGPSPARLASFPPGVGAARAHLRAVVSGDGKAHLSHNPLGAVMVWNIWATIAVLGLTGWMMGTLAFFGVEWVEDIHEIAYDWLIVSVVLHVAGVLIDTWRTGVPLVPAMITGRKRIPAGTEVE